MNARKRWDDIKGWWRGLIEDDPLYTEYATTDPAPEPDEAELELTCSCGRRYVLRGERS